MEIALALSLPTVPSAEMQTDNDGNVKQLLIRIEANEAASFRTLIDALRDRDWPTLSTLLTNESPPLRATKHHRFLRQVVECIPLDVLRHDARLSMWLGSLLAADRLNEALTAWDMSYHAYALQKDWTGRATTVAHALDAVLADARDLTRLDLWLDRALVVYAQRRHVSSPIWMRFIAATTAALSQRRPDDTQLADHVLALHDALEADDVDIDIALIAAAVAVDMAAWMGDFRRGASIHNRALWWLAKSHPNTVAATRYRTSYALYAATASPVHEFLDGTNDALVALHHCPSETATTTNVFLEMAIAYAASGRRDEAKRLIESTQSTIDCTRAAEWAVLYALRAWVALFDGDAAVALDFAEHAVAAATAAGARRTCGYALFVRAAALADLGRPDHACANAAQAANALCGFDSPLVLFHAACIRAYATLVAHGSEAAADDLRFAFGIARRRQLTNTLLWIPHMLTRLCDAALVLRIESDYVRQLIVTRAVRPGRNAGDSWPWPVKIYTLGSFRIVKNGELLVFKGKPQQRPLDLLKALIAYGACDVPVARLIDALWRDSDADGAKSTFDSTLHRLRKLLGHDDALTLSDGKLSLNPALCWLDCWCLEHTDESNVASTLRLYNGHFLCNDEEQSWTIPYRERLHSRYLRIVRSHGAKLEHAQHWQEAVELYERALELDPTAETVYAQLMTAYYRCGYRVEALNIYARCRRTLSALFGLPPPPQIERLHRQITQQR